MDKFFYFVGCSERLRQARNILCNRKLQLEDLTRWRTRYNHSSFSFFNIKVFNFVSNILLSFLFSRKFFFMVINLNLLFFLEN